MANSETVKVQQRILAAATDLFSRMGFNGVSTRDIARLAEVNETSIFRHYPRKRDLFVAALDAGFAKLTVRADLLGRLAAAPDAQEALRTLLQTIMQAVLERPGLVRLVHFSVLEFGSELDELYERHLRSLLQAAGEYLTAWPELNAARRIDVGITILAFVATVVSLQDFYPVLAGRQLSREALQQTAEMCTDVWYSVLSGRTPVESSPGVPLVAQA